MRQEWAREGVVEATRRRARAAAPDGTEGVTEQAGPGAAAGSDLAAPLAIVTRLL
jgi:hypothetical protein